MLIAIMLMAGINSAMMPIGNMMMGEGDYDGVRMLNTTVTKVVAVIFATVLILILCFPAAVLQLFGLDDTSIENGGSGAIRIFALLIPLQSYSMLRMTRLMILSYTKLASLSATLRVVLMLAVVALIAHIAPKHLWWGFPLSALMNETVIGFLSYRIHRRTPGTSPLTLIPKDSASTIWSSSLPYDLQSLSVILGEIERFLSKSHADDRTIKKIMLTTEELACNIIKFAQKGKVNQRFDILIRAMDDKFIVSLKDDGKPFNPIKKDGHHTLITESFPDLLNATIGLKIVNNIGLHLEYRYMYGQNIVNILGFRTRPTGASSGR
jgi:anti-sigma regulatory factor (Ser/Thr protein kinase)